MAANVLTLRMPNDLKERLARAAQHEGVSMNQLANYFLTRDVAQLEQALALERRLDRASLAALKRKARRVLDSVPDRPVPAWDRAD